MSIINVNTIQPIGAGQTVTVNASDLTLGSTILSSDGNGTIPSVKTDTIQTVDGVNIPNGAKLLTTYNSTGVNRTLVGDSGWVSHLSGTFSPSKTSNVLVSATFSMTYESGAVQSVCRLLIDGSDYGGFCFSKQSTANTGGAASGNWSLPSVTAGSHTYDLQVRNGIAGTTCILNNWDAGLGNNYSLDTIMFIYQ